MKIDYSHLKESDLSLLQINARLEARNEMQTWIIRILTSIIVAIIMAFILHLIF